MLRVRILEVFLQSWKSLLKDSPIKTTLDKYHLLFQGDLEHLWCSLRILNTITKFNSLEESPKREAKVKTGWSSLLISTINSDMQTKISIFSKILSLMRVFFKMFQSQIYLSEEPIKLYLKIKISKKYCNQRPKIF